MPTTRRAFLRGAFALVAVPRPPAVQSSPQRAVPAGWPTRAGTPASAPGGRRSNGVAFVVRAW